MSTEWIRSQVDRLLRNAEEALGRRDWTSVADLARDILALDPDNDDGRGLLAAADRALGSAEVASSTHVVEADSGVAERPEHPAAFADDRYQVKEFLGEGGKKRVYLAHDAVLERDVALAVIKTEGLDQTSRARITREARAMGRLGDHPQILPIHDLGEENGQPYMVQPFMAGGDIEALLAGAEGQRLPLEQALDLAMQMCRGLEHAHSNGIVHRDLKPGNVYLADGTAKIGDFGLAVVMDRSRLTQEGMMVGTVSYMPPEQAMGGDVTRQADLYSLGAMLYEMVCGRPPFLGDDSVAIIGQHINTPPVAPTWHRQECPRALEALVLRLLAKDPKERPQSAADVLRALEGIDLTAPVAELDQDEAHVLDSLAGGVFVGRQREMGELKAALEDALSGWGRLVTLVGEPGIGKTRTAQELATYAGLRGCQVLWGRCHESRGSPPYWPWVQAIRSYVREREPDQVASEMGTGAVDIAEIVSDVRERLPDLKPSPQLEDPEQARFRLFDSITTFLKTASRGQPLVMILDNLHWADKPTLLLLEFLAQELADSRLLVIGTYRDVDLSRQHPLAETLGELTRERLFQRVLLRGLRQDDVGRFIEITSGTAPPPGLVQAVHTQTEGNPLFVTEVVRLLVQEGELTQERARERDSWEVRIPEGVREVIGRRLNRLSARCNETLTIASVIGRQFELRQVGPLVEDMSEDRLLEVLEEALSARTIEELPQAVGHYQFTHVLIRQTLYDELTTTRRVRLHASIGKALEELYGDEVDSHAMELAHHFGEAEALLGPDGLMRYSKLAGERALAAYAYEEAIPQFQRAWAVKEGQPVDKDSAAILRGLGLAQLGTLPRNELSQAAATLVRALNYFIDLGEIDEVASFGEVRLPDVAMSEETTRAIECALDVVPLNSVQAGRLLARYGHALGLQRADYEGAEKAFTRALAIARHEDDVGLETQTLGLAAMVDAFAARWSECLDKSLRSMELAHGAGQSDPDWQSQIWAGRASLLLGNAEEAEKYASGALTAVQRFRDRYRIATVLLDHHNLAHLKGDWEAARAFNNRGLELSPDDFRLLYFRAILEYEVGNFGEGDTYLHRLERMVEVAPPGPGHDQAGLVYVIGAVAYIGGDRSGFDLAEGVARGFVEQPSVAPRMAHLARAGLGLIAVQRGQAGISREHYDALRPLRGMMVMSAFICSDRLLGLLAQTMGNLDQAVAHFDDALAFCRKARYRPELAWTCCDYADMLRERDDPGDQERATELLDESLAISTELGMRPLMERVLSRREILGA